MFSFRLFLSLIFAVILAYTSVVIAAHGTNLLPVFFSDMAQFAWPGQFNLDFLCFLLLSGIWLAWRHEFSLSGLGLAVVAIFGGCLFLSAYLLLQTFQAKGDMRVILLGPARAFA